MNTQAAAWRQYANDLAFWTWQRYVNRTDVWGAYLSLDARGKVTTADGKPIEKNYTAPAVENRGKVKLTMEHLRRHFAADDPGDVKGVHAIGHDGLSRWAAVEVDNHGHADAEINLACAIHWFDVLVSLGFNPLLTDSNGSGGYHLTTFFYYPIGSEHAHHFAKWLTRDRQVMGLSQPVEVFPKQPKLSKDKPYGNWLRLPGRHHTRPHWSRVYDGWRWIEGAEAVDFILRASGDTPESIPAEAEPPPPTLPEMRVVVRKFSADDKRVDRCRAYCRKIPASISGNYGHHRLLECACTCRKFGLYEQEALPILREFNLRCDPPWPESELSRKYHEAGKFVAASEFGSMMRETSTTSTRRVVMVEGGAI